MDKKQIFYMCLALLVMMLLVDPAFCITDDTNLQSAYKEVTKRGGNLTNIVLAISGLAAIGFAMFQEYGWAKGFGVGTALFAGYKHFVGDGAGCTLDMAHQLMSQNYVLIDQIINYLC